MKDIDIHKTLLETRDRAYRFVVNTLADAGFTLPEQGALAYEWALRQAELGNTKAQFTVAKLACLGLFGQQDRVLARTWCEEAANLGLPEAITMLGGFFDEGWGGLDTDHLKAASQWKTASALGETGAMCALAGMYIDGRSMTKDRAAGFSLLRQAAELGDELAQLELGIKLIDELDPALEAEALKWTRFAAESGNSTAHRILASYYRNGEHGLLVDRELAKSHEAMAAQIDANMR